MRPLKEIDELQKQGVKVENQRLYTRDHEGIILGWYDDLVEVDEAVPTSGFIHCAMAYMYHDGKWHHWMQHESSEWERERAGLENPK